MKKKASAKKAKRILIIVSIPVIAVSVIFLIMGINALNYQSYLRRVCTEQTIGIVYNFRVTGAVIDNEDEYRDYRTYIPLFEYEVDGKTYTLESEVGTEKKRFRLGQEVLVNYNPDTPAESYVPEDKRGASGIIFIVLAGILFALDITALIKVFILKEFDK